MATTTLYQDDIEHGGKHYRVKADVCTGCYKVAIQTLDNGRVVREMYAYADQLVNLHYEAILAGLEQYPFSVRFSLKAGIAILHITALRLELGLADAG